MNYSDLKKMLHTFINGDSYTEIIKQQAAALLEKIESVDNKKDAFFILYPVT